ncbi:AHH domain-containing protein [Nostoc sp.]|uniref:AHH domain-containing protein n=1 Tax=Nostoc sp. TaxID=1180 RepID=UPI002FFA3EF0
MSLFGFGGKKGQNAKKSKKSKPREVWQGKSFALDDIITPSVFVGGGENSPDPFLIDLHTLPGSEIDLSQSNLLQALDPNSLELLNQPHLSLLDRQTMSDWLVDPSYQPLPFFDNPGVSTNSFTENVSILHSSDTCPAESVAIHNGESLLGKGLPGDPTLPGTTASVVPQTSVDTGGNDFTNPTTLIRSAIQDIIDQVSNIDPIDIYRVNINDLKNADISVLSGEISVNYLMPSGQFLGSQVFSKGNYTLQPPVGITGDVIIKIDYQGGTPGTYILNGFESKAAEPFNIDLEFEGGLTASQQATIRAAAKSVEAMISQGLPTAIVDGKLIDDVNFKIYATNLDGEGGTAAQTNIDFMRFGTMLPAQSITQFDAADIAELESSGELFSVVQHELLHGLGFGNLWEAKGLVDYAGTPLAQYNGKEAVKAFNELGGLTDNIALENEGNGSAGLHWNESLFQDEAMTADYNNGKGGNAPISAVTIASLADLGYQVNLNRATPDFGLFGGQKFKPEDLTPEQIEAFRELAETSFGNPDEEFIYATMPEVDPDTVAPEIWAHAERAPNNQYYDWERYKIKSGDTLSGIALRTMGSGNSNNYWWIANHNGIPNPNNIWEYDWIYIPKLHPNYEWEQEQERLRREAELRQRQEEEARIRREQEEAFAREQERVRQEAEARQREAEAQQKQLEEQERRLREEMERRRQEEERLKEEARLREIERQAEITRQQGKGGLDWFIAKSLPEFGPVDPFETRLTGETVGNLVPDDYYRFTLSRNGRITAELKQLLADADLVLYDVRNRPISYSMRDGITDEQLIADLIPGTYMLRVNSPKGVTTDYELIVKFQHLLSATQKGSPPGWRVGGGNSGSSSSSSGSAGQIFADPRIKRIYDTALNNFVIPERAKANTRIEQLGREKQSYEQELQQLLDQMNGEQRAKVHRALDGIRDERRAWVDSVANPIKNGIDSTADWIIDQMESKIPGQVYNIPGIGDQLRSAKDSLKSGINGARSWLKGKVDGVQNAVKDAIWQFTEALKNAYRTGAEINGAIETAAQQLKQTIDNLVGNINNWVNEFKGKVLDSVQWLRNVGVNIPDIKDFWGHTLIPGFKWNFYDSVVEPLANSLANGIKSSVTSVGDFAKGTVDWIKPRAQSAVAAVVDAIFGDKTGTLYNKIHGVDQQIAATQSELERKIVQKATELKNQIQDFLNQLGSEGKKILDTILNFANSPAGQIGMAVLEVVLGMIPGVGQALDIKDTAVALYNIFVQGQRDVWEFIGLIGALAGWVPAVGDAVKSVAKIAKNGVDTLATFLKKLGPDVTKAAIKAIDSTNWGNILKNLISDLGKKWDNFSRSAENAAGWIIDALSLKPALATANNSMFAFRNGVDDVAEELTPTQRRFREAVEEAAEKASPRLIIGDSTKLGKNLIFENSVIPGTSFKYPGSRGDYQAHHLIPSAVANDSELMLNAVQYAKFDIDSAINGVFLPAGESKAIEVFEKTGVSLPIHLGSHADYSNRISQELRKEWDLIPVGKKEDPVVLEIAINRVITLAKNDFLPLITKPYP